MIDDLQNLMAGMVKPLEWVPFGERGFKTYCHLSMSSFYVSSGDDCAQIDKEHTARILAALNPDAVLALVAAAYADAAVVAADRVTVCGAREIASLVKEHVVRATPTDATAALARLMADARAEGFSDGYAKGFGDSGEGWNGEHPAHDFTTDKSWLAQRETAIRAMKGEHG